MATRPGDASGQQTGTAADPAAYDRGLRRYMLAVYDYMASGLLLTGIVALGFARTGLAQQLFFNSWLIKWLLILLPLVFVIVINLAMERMRPWQLHLMFWGYAAALGVSVSTIFLIYEPLAILQAFAATAAGFAGLSLYGYLTKRDLSVPGTFLVSGVTGLLVAIGINLYVQSGLMALLISAAGVLLFAGLTVVDTQKTRDGYARVHGTPGEAREVVKAALTLYLDFINLFVFLLKTAGKVERQ